MNGTWLMVDYGSVLANSHVASAEENLASLFGCERPALQAQISERSPQGCAIRLDELTEAHFWAKVADELGCRLPASPSELTRLWAATYEINDAVAAILRDAAAAGMRIGVATNLDRYREPYLLRAVADAQLRPELIASWRLGALKPDPEFYARGSAQLRVARLGDILFFDDRKSHSDAALAQGWTAYHFQDVPTFQRLVTAALEIY